MKNINRINFFQQNNIEPIKLQGEISINSQDTKVNSFKDTMADMIKEMNETTAKPAQLTADAMQGKADIHDVMAAIAKSELTVQVATTITGKVLQTYEKIMQIQI